MLRQKWMNELVANMLWWMLHSRRGSLEKILVVLTCINKDMLTNFLINENKLLVQSAEMKYISWENGNSLCLRGTVTQRKKVLTGMN